MSTFHDAELRKVQLERDGSAESSSESSDSEAESLPTSIDSNVSVKYIVDAIKWARWYDSRRTRTDGWVGWHYGVMWEGYLKTQSDTEEPYSSFVVDDDTNKAPLVEEFWAAVGRPILPGRDAPRPRIKRADPEELVECPRWKLKERFLGAKPRRDINVYRRRREKELKGLPITKADSDYYARKKRIAEKRKRKAAEAKGLLEPKTTNKSNQLAVTSATTGPTPSTATTVIPEMTTINAPTPSSESLDKYAYLFDSDPEDEPPVRLQQPPTKTTQKRKAASPVPAEPSRPSELTKKAKPASVAKKVSPKKVARASSKPPQEIAAGKIERLAGLGKIKRRTEEEILAQQQKEAEEFTIIPTFGEAAPDIFPAADKRPPPALPVKSESKDDDEVEEPLESDQPRRVAEEPLFSPADRSPSPPAIRSQIPAPSGPSAVQKPIPTGPRPKYQQPRLTKDIVSAEYGTHPPIRPPNASASSRPLSPRKIAASLPNRPVSPVKGLPPIRPVPTGPKASLSFVPRRTSGDVPTLLAPLSSAPSVLGPSLTTSPSLHVSPSLASSPSLPAAPASVYDQTRDPRRKRPTAPADSVPTRPSQPSSQPPAPASSTSDPLPISARSLPMRREGSSGSENGWRSTNTHRPGILSSLSMTLQAPPPAADARFDVQILSGSKPSSAETDFIRKRLNSVSTLIMEPMDVEYFVSALKLGARMQQWAKVTHAEQRRKDPAERASWSKVKSLSSESRRMWVCYTDSPDVGGLVFSHQALVMVRADQIDLSPLNLGPWKSSEIGFALVLLALPIGVSSLAPRLPSPVRPLIDPLPPAPIVPFISTPATLLESFGISQDFLRGLRGRPILKLPGPEGAADALHTALVGAFRDNGALPSTNGMADVVVIGNAKLLRSLAKMELKNALLRRGTSVYAVGPSLALHPKQWTLRPIWQAGALVTFSPTLILRSPAKFVEILSMVRSSESWGAYVLPSVVEWVVASWQEKARCPEPSKAYDAFLAALAFAGDSGGLAVSCAPPSPSMTRTCALWTAWVQRTSRCTDLEGILATCKGVRSGSSTYRAQAPSGQLELIDVETEQIEDLTAMRAQPHTVPFRRYLYVGEVSDRARLARLGQAVELVAVDDFAAIFSGAV